MESIIDFSAMISPSVLNKHVEFWINEDIPNFDLSTLVVCNRVINANIEVKETAILAGLPFAEAVLKYFDCVVEWKYKEGSLLDKRSVIGVITGVANKVLMTERTVLNILSRCCGVATIANKLSLKVKSKWNGELSGTRKTTPGFRIVEKYGMYIGGISTHRYDLSTMIMIKDNHIKANGSIEKCVKILRAKTGKLLKIEVECSNLNEAIEAAKHGADVIMLDNFNANDVRSVSKQVKNINPSVLVEASGGINEINILEYAVDNVDIISSSLFSQGYKCIDVSLNTITNCVSSVPESVSESVKVTINEPKIENISSDKKETISAPIVVSNLCNSTDKEKPAIKRKLEESNDEIVDKPLSDTTKLTESSDKLISPAKQPTLKPSPNNNKPVNKYDPTNKQRKMNTNGKVGQAIYNLQSVGSVRMPGQPVRFENKAHSNRANMDNQANFIRTMAANLVMSLQSSQSSNASFMNPTPMRFGGPVPRVPFMNNMKSLFCKVCNFQNPNTGNPFCQICRKKLE